MAQHLNKIDLKKFPAASSSALEFSASTDSASAPRLKIEAGGKHVWSDGSVVGDTNLYRSAADTLKTDDYFIATGGLTVETYQVTTVGASSGTVLKFDGTKFAPGVASTVGNLDDLADVVISSPTTNQALIYNGTQWVNGSAGAAGSTYVATIGNGASTTFVVSHGLNTRDVFVQVRNANSPYEVIDVQWEATSTSTVTFNFSTPPASNSVRVAIYAATTGTNIALPLDGLTDVTITTPEEFQSLTYNGTEWVNNYAPTVTYVRNAETTTLTTGTVVYLFGATGDHASVKRASKSSDTTSSKTIGLVAAPITANNNGPVVTRGYVDGIDLSVGYTAGDILWLDTNGNFTKTKAVAPAHLVFIGVVVRATNNGIVYVATQNGYELDELHNVSLPSPQSGDFLKYNGSLWVADAIDLGTDTNGNYLSNIVAGTGVTVSFTPSEGASASVSIGQPVATSSNVTFASVTTSSITTTGGVSGNIVINPNSLSGSGSQTAPYISIAGADATGTVAVTGGPILIYGGQAFGGSNNTGGAVTIDGGYGSTIGGYISIGAAYASSVTIGSPNAATTINGNLTVVGDLTVSGTTTTLNTTQLLVEDNIVTLNSGETGSPTLNAGIEVERGTSTNVQIRWNETTDKWQFTNDGTTYKDLGSGGITVSDTAPSTPATGDLWYESDTGSTYVYYDSYWIEIGGSTAYDQIIGTIQAKGDLLAGTASQAIARLAVGTNGTRLVADPTTATGLAWASDTQNTVIDAKGDLLVGLADNTVGKLTVGTNGQILVADSSQTAGVGWTELNTRNLLYNGSMQVAQRGASAAGVNGTNYYTVDRWQQGTSSAGTWTQTQESDGPANAGFTKSLKMLCTTAQTPLSASSILYIQQPLEGQDCQAIRKGTAQAQQLTLSFWVKSNVTGTYVVSLIDDDNTRDVGRTYTVNSSGTWEFKTLTFPADTTGALANDNGRSLMAFFWLAAGSNFTSGTLNTSWASITTANRAVGQVNLASATNNYWQVTGVQLNVGPVAAPFEFKSFGRELAECQRYYTRFSNWGAFTQLFNGHATSTSNIRAQITFPVQMRISATGLVVDNSAFSTFRIVDGVNAFNPTGISLSTAGTGFQTAGVDFSAGAVFTQYRPYWIDANNQTVGSAYVGFSAEL